MKKGNKKGQTPFFTLFSGVFSKHPALSMILHSISEKEMLAINKGGVDFKGIFSYKGVSSLRERK